MACSLKPCTSACALLLQLVCFLSLVSLDTIFCYDARSIPPTALSHWVFKDEKVDWPTCRSDVYIYLQPKYKGLHNQVNVMLTGLTLSEMYNITFILPDWFSHYEPALTSRQGVYVPLCTQGSADALHTTQPPKCTMVLEFGQIWDEDHFYSQMRPHHCIIKSSTAREMGLIPNVANIMRLAYDLNPLPLLDAEMLHNRTAAADVRAALVQHALERKSKVLHVRSIVGSGNNYLNADSWKNYMRMRLRAAAALEPSKLVNQFAQPILAGLAAKGQEFNAVHFRVEKDMQDWLARKRGTTFMDAVAVVEWIAVQESLNKSLPLYVAHDTTVEVSTIKAAFSAAGFSQIFVKSDFAPQVDAIGHREFRAAIERAVLEKARVFVGSYYSSLSNYIYEKRRALGQFNLDYNDKEANLDLWRVMQGHTSGSVNIKKLTICLWSKITTGAYGGSSIFMQALAESFMRLGHTVTSVFETYPADAALVQSADIHILNQNQYNMSIAEKFVPLSNITTKQSNASVVFRTDGPFTLHRRRPGQDVRLFQKIASFKTTSTVFQSVWSYVETVKLGFEPINPALIGNAADPKLFYPPYNKDYNLSARKAKVVMSVFNKDPRKNYEIFQYLDSKLDPSRYELYLIGTLPPSMEETGLKNVKYIPPVGQKQLANLLRTMDIFLAPSFYECFSNSEVQALSCGLPVLGLYDSSHPEVVGTGGVFFTGESDVVSALEKLVANYEHYAKSIVVPHIDELAYKYLVASGRF